MLLKGYFFDGKTSARHAAEVVIDEKGIVQVHLIDNPSFALQEPISDCRISHRLANTPRFIYFSDQQKFETLENDKVDAAVKAHPQFNFLMNLVHQLESHSLFVLLTIIVMAGASWFGYKYGLPRISKTIAYHLPATVMNTAATQTLTLLDKTHLGPSQLTPEVQSRVLAHFQQAINENKTEHIKVIFRDGKAIGPNAFALPDGTVIFTDAMVNMAENDDELLAVLAHEIGHVKYRHAVRATIQNSSIGIFVSLLIGDAGGAASGIIIALPVVLTTMAYSRDFERESDDNALAYLKTHKIDTLHFVNLMERVTQFGTCYAHVEGKEKSTEAISECKQKIVDAKSEKTLVNDAIQYLSSHPATQERLEKFRH